MIRLSVICNERLCTIDLPDAAQQTVNTPLSLWEPAQVADGELRLPKGWVTSEEPSSDRVSLRTELNMRLRRDDRRALLMVRLLPEGGLPDVVVRAEARFTVGRSRSNELCCRDSFLSTAHGVFTFTGNGEMCYEDTSTNGTYLNGELLHGNSQLLKPGDQLDFPPLLQVVVDGAALRVRYPSAHGYVQLPALPPVEGEQLRAAVYLTAADRLCHVCLRASLQTGAELLSCILPQLPPETAALLPATPLLRVAGETALLHANSPVSLREGMILVLG